MIPLVILTLHLIHQRTGISTHTHKEMRLLLSVIRVEKVLVQMLVLVERNHCCTGNHPTLHCTLPARQPILHQ